MAFPSQRPTSREFNAGDWPTKTFKAQNGVEIRILYGDQRTNMTLSLTYSNITDANAEAFLTHYRETRGTYSTFTIPTEAKAGWTGSADEIDATPWNNRWRYSGPPTVTSVKQGRSTVKVDLIGVL
jgi:hypothetical protein